MPYILVWLLVGLLAGLLVHLRFPGGKSASVLSDLMAGAMGALIGEWLFDLVLGYRYGGWVTNGLAAFGGALLLLLLDRAFTMQPKRMGGNANGTRRSRKPS